MVVGGFIDFGSGVSAAFDSGIPLEPMTTLGVADDFVVAVPALLVVVLSTSRLPKLQFFVGKMRNKLIS